MRARGNVYVGSNGKGVTVALFDWVSEGQEANGLFEQVLVLLTIGCAVHGYNCMYSLRTEIWLPSHA